jgi:aspartyl-tRNA(Asn)/glutamyl-tRNA(Gln) amidotransferase subunit C
MSLSLEEVRRAAALSRLRLTAEEEALFAGQLGKVVDYIDQLREFEALPAAATADAGREAPDDPRPDPRGELFADNAPETRGPFYVVPRMRAGGGVPAGAEPADE